MTEELVTPEQVTPAPPAFDRNEWFNLIRFHPRGVVHVWHLGHGRYTLCGRELRAGRTWWEHVKFVFSQRFTGREDLCGQCDQALHAYRRQAGL
jgi:hypothetical protein